MSQEHTERLRAIKTFPQLVVYLRDELGWEVSSDDFEELTFEYSAEELGLDSKSAAKVKEIRRLRPLVTNQPWGIFFVNFEPRRLPVVALRRVLRALVTKKRASANPSERPAWAMGDLLFISSYGEADHRDISFAHFVQAEEPGDLPTLKVLGWDDEDTTLRLRDVQTRLREFMRWPEDTKDVKAWRERWAKAFVLAHREVIRTSKDLAVQMARLAQRIRKRALKVLEVESDKGPLRKMMEAFKEALIHDLDDDGFADMYAQTITYGLLTARVSREAGLVAENVVDMVPVTNPFLRDMLQMFLTVGGRKAKIDFDELGINEVVHALREANMEQVLKDFGDKNPQEDPVIHFYELFLKEYDAKKRMQRGVFYTPRPVVSYIVRSVHELLQTEFGLEDGLADTTTWGEMAKRHKGLKIPDGVDPKSPFVNILDPATGTATFLVEVIDLIHKTMKAKWLKQGHMALEIGKLWNEYVPEHLLPRVHGYELLMAPYAVAHMKIGLKLWETGYRFKSNERARVYLTNALEPGTDKATEGRIEDFAPALAHEATAVNSVKRHGHFTILIGNPPYSVVSVNNSQWIVDISDEYKKTVRSTERQIQALSDDYVKFVRLAQWHIERSGTGAVGIISNNGFLDGHLFSDMRRSLASAFPIRILLNLHGNLRTQERTPTGGNDDNVFDIQTGVSISLLGKPPRAVTSAARYYDLWGSRLSKYSELIEQGVLTTPWVILAPRSESSPWIPRSSELDAEWEAMASLIGIFGSGSPRDDAQKRYAAGFVSQQDDFAIAFSPQEIENRVSALLAPATTEGMLRQHYRLCTTSQWSFKRAREELGGVNLRDLLTQVSYRPFDRRYTVFHRGVVTILRKEVMRHLVSRGNLALLATRGVSRQSFAHAFVVDGIVDRHALDNASESMFVFPLFVYPDASVDTARSGMFSSEQALANVSPTAMRALQKDSLPDQYALARHAFNFMYAVLHSQAYRERYAEFLKTDFPRVPLTGESQVRHLLASLGGELITLHLLESPKLDKHRTEFVGKRGTEIEKVTYADQTVWIDKKQTTGFKGVPEDVWNFHIGGYQVCHKWLKDRKGRTLSQDDINHYHKIVVALSETIRLMAEIDKAINQHGGWPAAFQPRQP